MTSKIPESTVLFLDPVKWKEIYPELYHESLCKYLTQDHIVSLMNDVLSTYRIWGLKGLLPGYNYNLCVDVGSNIGAATLHLARIYQKTVAFEADPVNYDYSVANLAFNKQNGCIPATAQTQCFNLAAASQSGKTLHIYESSDNPGGNSTISTHCNREEDLSSRSCKTINFQDMCEKLGTNKIDFLKVDIEGAEYDFLLDQDLGNVQYLIVEVHQIYDTHEENQKIKSKLLQHFQKYFHVVAAEHGRIVEIDNVWCINKALLPSLSEAVHVITTLLSVERFDGLDAIAVATSG